MIESLKTEAMVKGVRKKEKKKEEKGQSYVSCRFRNVVRD